MVTWRGHPGGGSGEVGEKDITIQEKLTDEGLQILKSAFTVEKT